MKSAGTYQITRQGQITIPSVVREKLKLEEGDIMDFYYSDDIVLIKKKREPLQTFRELAEKTRKRFEEKKISRKNVEEAIREMRKKR